MGMTVEKLTAQHGILYVSVRGEFSLEDAKRTFLLIVGLIEQNQSEKVVIDGRAITGNPKTVERFYYGAFTADAVLRLKATHSYIASPKFAYVLQTPMLDPERLGETVAVNRGMKVKAFDSLDKALEWLG